MLLQYGISINCNWNVIGCRCDGVGGGRAGNNYQRATIRDSHGRSNETENSNVRRNRHECCQGRFERFKLKITISLLKWHHAEQKNKTCLPVSRDYNRQPRQFLPYVTIAAGLHCIYTTLLPAASCWWLIRLGDAASWTHWCTRWWKVT